MTKLKGKVKVKRCLHRGAYVKKMKDKLSERKEKERPSQRNQTVLPCGFVCYNTCSCFYLPQETGMRADAGIGLRETHDLAIASALQGKKYIL